MKDISKEVGETVKTRKLPEADCRMLDRLQQQTEEHLGMSKEKLESLQPGFTPRLQKAAKEMAEEVFEDPTRYEYALIENAMLRALVEYMEWKLDLAEAAHECSKLPK
jgi:hypothetical protein